MENQLMNLMFLRSLKEVQITLNRIPLSLDYIATKSGVEKIMITGTTLQESKDALEMANTSGKVYCAPLI